MKKSFRIASVIFLAAAWFIVSGTASISHGGSDFRDDPASTQAYGIQDLSAKIFFNTSQAESLLDSFNNLPVPSLKDPFNEPGSVNIAIEQIFEVGFAQYIRHSINFLVHHRKADIIFPFHYFW